MVARAGNSVKPNESRNYQRASHHQPAGLLEERSAKSQPQHPSLWANGPQPQRWALAYACPASLAQRPATRTACHTSYARTNGNHSRLVFVFTLQHKTAIPTQNAHVEQVNAILLTWSAIRMDAPQTQRI